MMAAIKMFNSMDSLEVEKKILSLSGYLIDKLKEYNFDIVTSDLHSERAGIVLFATDKNNEEIHQKLKEKRITISLRENYLRVSPHYYNNKNDLDVFLDALLDLTQK